MKLIDLEQKGNSFRLYFGEDSLETWYGDDWNDPIDNSDLVYSEFIKDYIDVSFPFSFNVFSYYDYQDLSNLFITKDLIRDKKFVILAANNSQISNDPVFEALFSENSIKLYMGMDYSKVLKLLDKYIMKDVKND